MSQITRQHHRKYYYYETLRQIYPQKQYPNIVYKQCLHSLLTWFVYI